MKRATINISADDKAPFSIIIGNEFIYPDTWENNIVVSVGGVNKYATSTIYTILKK